MGALGQHCHPRHCAVYPLFTHKIILFGNGWYFLNPLLSKVGVVLLLAAAALGLDLKGEVVVISGSSG